MKSLYPSIITFLFLFAHLGFSQQTPENLIRSINANGSNTIKATKTIHSKNRQVTIAEKNKTTTENDLENFSTDESSVGATSGNFSVSLSGSATYTIPIATPVGIKTINPNISLNFNSQVGNGLAGWGWGISGLSTITRVPATIFHDGFVNGVNFNEHDRFTLDGQRLILKTGKYGEPNSTYQTETYSNIKVKAIGTSSYGSNFGPSHFVVYYPDGTRAWYGTESTSKNKLEWVLVKREDPQGNKIEYDYTNDGKLIIINKIKFGHNNGQAPVEINFYYKNRKRPELFFVEGERFKRTKILSSIDTRGNGNIYREYKLKHFETNLGYDRLFGVSERNNKGKRLPTVLFSYGYIPSNPEPDVYSGEIHPGFDYEKDEILSGEFNGDGKLDFIKYNKKDKTKISIFDNLYEIENNTDIATEYDVPRFDQVIANNMLNHEGKKLAQQGITFISEQVEIKDGKATVEFKSYYKGAPNMNYHYTKTWTAPTTVYEYDCESSVSVSIPKKYVSGDFNGDGLTDVLAIQKEFNIRDCYYKDTDNDFPDDDCECEDYQINKAITYFVDLNRNLTSDYTHDAGRLRKPMDSADRVLAADFNGDGKTDLFHFKEGAVYIYELNQKNELVLIYTQADELIKLNRPILLGDYNGDGKTDFLVPKEHMSNEWKFFLSTGKDTFNYTKELGYIVYENNRPSKAYKYMDGPISDAYLEKVFVAQDVNGDGKTDIIKHAIATAYSSVHNYSDDILTIYANVFNEDEDTPSFEPSSNYVRTNTGIKKFGTPIFLQPHEKSDNLEYAYINTRRLTAYKFEDDHRYNVILKEIYNNGKRHKIEYAGLTFDKDNYISTYTPDYEEVYPYVNINNVPSLKLVSKVQEESEGFLRSQDFRYTGAVSHATGIGIFAFKQFGKSNIHGNGVQQLWTITDNDIQKRGVPLINRVTANYTSSPEKFISKNEYLYDTKLTENKVFINTLSKVVSEDALTGISTTKTIAYDAYYSPHTTKTIFPNGSETITQKFIHKPDPFDETYAIGRLLETKTNTILNGSSFSTAQEYVYDNNLVKETRKQGNGTDWLSENYVYDNFGNIIENKIGGKGVEDRIEKFKFDASGRFMVESIDNENFKTTYEYDLDTGSPLKVINHYGLAVTYVYDGWGRVEKEINHLGKTTTKNYENFASELGNGSIAKYVYDESGAKEYKFYNALGWLVKEGTSSINDKVVYKEYKYDASGKKIKESEPYFGGEKPTKWHSYSFDEYERPISQQYISGKVVTTTYNGLSTTVDDGDKIVTSTKDALGNIVSIKDDGGTINYTYYPNGVLKSTDYDGHIISVGIDGWGRKKYMTDPSAGTYTYQYNILGELLKETTPKGATEYKYNKHGKIINEKIIGNNTNMETNYEYDAITKLLSKVNAIDKETGKHYKYEYTYDDKKRISKILENTGSSLFEKQLFYDDFGRLSKENYSAFNIAGINSKVNIKNVYDTSGVLKEIRDANSDNLLWRIDAENAQGKALQISLGNDIKKTREYDDYGALKQIFDRKTAGAGEDSSSVRVALKMDYSFNAKKGVLNSRKNHGFNNWEETFTHDNLNRLTGINGSVNQKQEYDKRGRIKNNSWVGTYNYDKPNIYRLKNINLNNQGDLYYQQNSLQQITYNAYKKPSQILKKDKGRVDFEYGPFKNRTYAYYGGMSKEKEKRNNHKHYSSIIPVEIVENKETGSTKVITYIGGDAYTAPIAHIKQEGEGKINDFHYLHRDYLGSILAISDSKANIVEERQFGAWGTIDQFRASNKAISFTHNSILSRGFTGHEHFFEVGLIHMNGRMYDHKTRRFLSPDNYIQEPFSTKSYDRYGYVWNNPLIYNDPSGEIFESYLTAKLETLKNIFTHGVNFDHYTYERTGRALQIDKGLFTGNFGDILSKWTWELPQTLLGNKLGHVLNIVGNITEVNHFDGAVVLSSARNDGGAFTIGNNIFGPRRFRPDFRDHLFVHEFGHYLQSKRVGPLYLSFVALPSVTDFYLVDKLFGENHHDTRWYEAQASRLAANYFDERFGTGADGYEAENIDFFDRERFITGRRSLYTNPRFILRGERGDDQFNMGANPINSRFHWTDFPVNFYNLGLGVLGNIF